MVKRLRHVWKGIKLLVLLGAMLVIGLGFWLHAKERSLNFLKPWITAAINEPEAPYTISIGEVTVDWTNAALLGTMRIKSVSVAKRDGDVFGQLPEVYATIDPIGFLPKRHFLHKVILREPHLALVRDEDGDLEFGLEDAPARMELSALMAFAGSDKSDAGFAMPSLPFHDFIIQNAQLTFHDTRTESKIVSTPFNFQLKRRRSSYDALVSIPFAMDDKPAKVLAAFRSVTGSAEHKLQVQLQQFPMELFCRYGTCAEGIRTAGLLDATVVASVAEDMGVHGFHITLSTPSAVMTTPEIFAEPLKFTNATMEFEGDWSKKQVTLTKATLPLEDTTITAAGLAHREENGWYVKGEGACSQIDVRKLYKYWPLVLAPDSRTWITSKLKSGYAAKGTMKVDFTPEDFASTNGVPDTAVDAIADARDITFEYLPGFPPVEHMNGIAHFTGKTVKVEGANSGSLLSGTKVSKAVLWCPELDNPKNPMDVTLELTAPAADAATILALKHFPFDDSFGLDPKTIKGTVDGNMKLKFNAFSGKPVKDPNEIHLEAVTYDITAKLNNVAQDHVTGGYDVKSLNGTLKATNGGMKFDGTAAVGAAPASSLSLSQDEGKPLHVSVKSAESKGRPGNDFALSYQGGEVPNITLSGKRLDAGVSYGSAKGDSILKKFPAMKLDVNLDELYLAAAVPFRSVVGTLSCSAAKCESANFTAKAEKADIAASIKSSGGARQFSLTASDAGGLLKAMDISDRVSKGKLSLKGPYDDGKNPPQLNARLLISDFTLKNSEILGRILAIGSLTGLANALTGSGIEFDKFAADVTSRGGVITVDKGLASSNALGITNNGTVDLNTDKLNLRGVVAPAYALNSFLGKIPIIGAIAGGEQGLIAFNYSVTGTSTNPDVGVNPLSGLTPGFLRGIFGALDNDAPKPANRKSAPSGEPGASSPASNVQKR